MKKLDKLNTLSEERREELAREKIDQVVECFPNSLPEDLPKILGKTKWSMPAKEMEGWDQWWGMHTQVEAALRGQARRIGAWWSFTGRPHPGEDEVLASLKRLASGVLTHPVTIGQMIDKHTPKRKKDKPKSIHLMGTDRPEATMIYAGFFIEILNANPGKSTARPRLFSKGSYADQPQLQVDSLGRTLSRLLEQIHQHQEGGEARCCNGNPPGLAR